MYIINDITKLDKDSTLKAYMDVWQVSPPMLIRGCKLFSNGKSQWVRPPSVSYQNSEGETKYKNLTDMYPEDLENFSKKVLEALKKYDPNAPKPFSFKKKEKKEEENDLPF